MTRFCMWRRRENLQDPLRQLLKDWCQVHKSLDRFRTIIEPRFLGRAYNISVQTMSEDEISTPTTAQYRTVPLKPAKISFDKDKITTNSFVVHWEPPVGRR